VLRNEKMEETLLEPLKISPQEVVYRDRNQTIQRTLAHFDGFTKEYFVSDHGKRVALVAIRNGEVLLTRQYRLIINRLSHEVPGGGMEAGESPAIAAARECLEETGVKCRNLHPLLSFHPGLDICKNFTYIFWTDECHEAVADNDERRIWIPLAKCVDMVFSQEIVDSLSVIALLAYYVLVVRGEMSGAI
jgi:ADP-ribose pyrophosphatase